PHVVRVLGCEPDRRVLAGADPAALPGPLRDLEPCFPPETVDPLLVHGPAFVSEYGPRPAVPVAGVLLRDLEEAGHARAVLRRALRRIAVGRPGLPDDAASSPLADLERPAQVCDGLAAASGAQNFPRSTSLSMSLSRACSARSFLSRAFSCSNSRRRFASGLPTPVYFLRQR